MSRLWWRLRWSQRLLLSNRKKMLWKHFTTRWLTWRPSPNRKKIRYSTGSASVINNESVRETSQGFIMTQRLTLNIRVVKRREDT